MGCDDEEPRIGYVCIDQGTCHHRCTEQTGCFRRQGCVPLALSGLDDHWRTPEQAAHELAAEISTHTPIPADSCKATPSRL